MGTRLVFADMEWIASDLELDEVAALIEDGRLVPARRAGKRVLVNPAHVLSAEEWTPPAAKGDRAD
jgi:hypothetical protein